MDINDNFTSEHEIYLYCRSIVSCGECQLSKYCRPCKQIDNPDFFCTSKLDYSSSCTNHNFLNICASAWPWWSILCIISICLIIFGIITYLLYRCCTCFFSQLTEIELQELRSKNVSHSNSDKI
ncbi:uncharacterized protein CMU_001100 [Cryptosporidium muris RN66]|uniref:Uncharacterized protein n=1 Tax=Cryptosporidium muris (strain RN66) TaxID=441375 RepID=B6AG98_CRYMR|nr:uncharacterized protein CMU_001100 [Cryptosporidium muris RN66]EEA07239.1 hypothetical protein, conserved [Cryptosporidium muris RN66]|eukprot:XP_002141588.1 hypothetical protein [Cryptosporidium muris RN66]